MAETGWRRPSTTCRLCRMVASSGRWALPAAMASLFNTRIVAGVVLAARSPQDATKDRLIGRR